jgi:hypothetical protein
VTITRGLIGCLDLLHLYAQLVITSNTALPLSPHITVHCSKHLSSKLAFTSRFLVTDVNSGDYTSLTVTTAHVKSFLHSQTLNSTELHSITLMPQLLNSIPSLDSSASKPTSWQAGILKLNWLADISSRSSSTAPQLSWDPLYTASGPTQQKTPFPNNPSLVACVFVTVGTCLPSRCLEMNVYSGSTIPASRRHVTIF